MTSTGEVLSLRELNRALLSRQLLLERPRLPADPAARTARVVQTVEHLAGLQAQAPFPPYYGLHSRLDGFVPEDLATLITGREVVRIALMRGTIHLVSARDCLPLRRPVQPVIERGLRSAFGKQLAGVDPVELAAAGRALVEAEPMTFSALGQALAGRWPRNPPAALAQGVRAYVPLVQVPPRAVWGQAGQPRHTSAEHWLGQPAEPYPVRPATPAELAGLVTRYLGAFGPATVRDIQAWSGLTGLKAVVEELRPALVTFADEQGAELFDLPGAPRPGAGVPAPARLVAEFDNLVLSHTDRSRVISAGNTKRLYTVNGVIPGAVLIDGFVAGMWRLAPGRTLTTLGIELFGSPGGRPAGQRPADERPADERPADEWAADERPADERPADERAADEQEGLIGEAERVLAFCAPGTAHDIRFGPLAELTVRRP